MSEVPHDSAHLRLSFERVESLPNGHGGNHDFGYFGSLVTTGKAAKVPLTEVHGRSGPQTGPAGALH